MQCRILFITIQTVRALLPHNITAREKLYSPHSVVSIRSSERTCQAVDDSTAVNCAVCGARLVKHFFVRQRLLQYCQSNKQTK